MSLLLIWSLSSKTLWSINNFRVVTGRSLLQMSQWERQSRLWTRWRSITFTPAANLQSSARQTEKQTAGQWVQAFFLPAVDSVKLILEVKVTLDSNTKGGFRPWDWQVVTVCSVRSTVAKTPSLKLHKRTSWTNRSLHSSHVQFLVAAYPQLMVKQNF